MKNKTYNFYWFRPIRNQLNNKYKLLLLLWLSVFLFGNSAVNAQTCCRTDVLTINTGYNPTSGTAMGFGSSDPKWTLTAISPGCAAIPGAVPVNSAAVDIAA